MAMTGKFTISWTVAALVTAVLLSASLMAVAQTGQAADEPVKFRGNPEFGDPTTAADPLADFLSPAPMGPPQTFAVTPREARSAAQTPAAPVRNRNEVRKSRRVLAQDPGFKHRATRTASARPLRLDPRAGQASGTEAALSFAPVERRRPRNFPLCFPSSASEQNGLGRCNTAMPYRGRFEELLAE
jgi:hypothetical protein